MLSLAIFMNIRLKCLQACPKQRKPHVRDAGRGICDNCIHRFLSAVISPDPVRDETDAQTTASRAEILAKSNRIWLYLKI